MTDFRFTGFLRVRNFQARWQFSPRLIYFGGPMLRLVLVIFALLEIVAVVILVFTV